MKKIYTTQEYKEKHQRKLEALQRKNRKHKKLNIEEKKERQIARKRYKNYQANRSNLPFPVFAPSDFRLIENHEACLNFFRDVRDSSNMIFFNNQRQVSISLVDVTQIDYATISVLTAISDDLKSRNINLSGDFPLDADCKNFIIQSGFLNHMVDGRNRKFPNHGKSKLIFFEKGAGILSREESKKITELIKEVVKHLTGKEKNIKPLKSILLEICGNSIEHAKTKDRQWLLGVKFVNDQKVLFTVTDVGKGILETLFITQSKLMRNLVTFKSKLDILIGAFEQKYGSSTQEQNRNKGLPAVKRNSDTGTIKNLIVLTNNVILHFENQEKSVTFLPGAPRFKGTMYQWELNQDCITNSINTYHEN